jgi:hypothetical protein
MQKLKQREIAPFMGGRISALHDIDKLFAEPSMGKIKLLLLLTANLQELSIESGWGNEFNDLASQLECLLEL